MINKQMKSFNNNIEEQETLLIQSLKIGSHKAFDQIYKLYAKRLYAYSLQFTKSPEDSEEIVQDVFIKLWVNKEKIRQEDTLQSLLYIMTKHYLINAFRARVNQPVYEDFIWYKNEIAVNDTAQHIELEEFTHRFTELLKKLPLTQQKVITMSRIDQLSNKQIAKALSLSEQTVKNQISIALKILKKKIIDLNYVLYLLLFVN